MELQATNWMAINLEEKCTCMLRLSLGSLITGPSSPSSTSSSVTTSTVGYPKDYDHKLRSTRETSMSCSGEVGLIEDGVAWK